MGSILDVSNMYNELLSLSSLISVSYKDLEMIELSSLDDNTQYEKIVNRILSLKDKEREIYNYINSTPNAINSLFMYATNQKKLHLDAFSIENLFDDDDNISKRLMYFINDQIVSNTKDTSCDQFNGYGEVFKNYMFLKVLNDDLVQAFLSINSDSINEESDLSIKSSLINLKYNAIFLNKTLEECMIKNRFKNNKNNIFFLHKYMFNFLGVDKKTENDTYSSYCLKVLNEQFDNIIKYSDSNIDLEKFKGLKAHLIARRSLISSILLFLDDDIRNMLFDDCKDKYNNLNKDFFDTYISYAFNNSNNYKDKVKEISLGR